MQKHARKRFQDGSKDAGISEEFKETPEMKKLTQKEENA